MDPAGDAGGPRERVPAVRALHDVAAGREGAAFADLVAVRESEAAERTHEGGRGGLRGFEPAKGDLVPHSGRESARSAALSAAPTARAKGKMKAAMARAVRQPRSFTIMKKLATHGMKSVIVVMATTIWT